MTNREIPPAAATSRRAPDLIEGCLMQTPDEKRGYSKGYAAGKRLNAMSYSRSIADRRREEFRQKVFLAVLPELIRAPWRTGEKRWTSMKQFTDGAWEFADIAAKGGAFSGEADVVMMKEEGDGRG